MKKIVLLLIATLLYNLLNAQTITNPRAMAEWEEVQGVLFNEFKIPDENLSSLEKIAENEKRRVKFIIAKIAVEEGIMVYVIEPEDNGFREHCINNGLPEDKIINVVYNPTTTDISGWERDEGPASIYKNEVGELHFAAWYNDRGAVLLANKMNVPLLQDNNTEYSIFTDGGNYLTDGHGRLFADSDALFGSPISDFIKNHYKNNMGIDDIVKLPPYVVHIDYYLKLINEETFVVSDIPQSNYNTQMDSFFDDSLKIQQAVDYIKNNYVSCYGRPYKFVKITNAPTIMLTNLNVESSTSDNGYTNALILNKTVLVPMYDSIFDGNTAGIAEFDNNALEKYREIMPGYRIVGIPGQALFMGGSVHCLTREIGAAEPVYISHAWLPDTVNATNEGYKIKAVVKTTSGVKSAKLFWATEPDLTYLDIEMNNTALDTFVATIPAQVNGTKVHYYIQAESNSGKVNQKPMVAPNWAFSFFVSDGSISIAENNHFHKELELLQNFPNPFNTTTTIKFGVAEASQTKITVYDIFGKQIDVLLDSYLSSGIHEVTINTSNWESGIYFYRLSTKGFSKTQKMVKN